MTYLSRSLSLSLSSPAARLELVTPGLATTKGATSPSAPSAHCFLPTPYLPKIMVIYGGWRGTRATDDQACSHTSDGMGSTKQYWRILLTADTPLTQTPTSPPSSAELTQCEPSLQASPCHRAGALFLPPPSPCKVFVHLLRLGVGRRVNLPTCISSVLVAVRSCSR